MKIQRWHAFNLASQCAVPPCALTIGNFDGMHRGHQALVEKLHEHKGSLSAEALIFEPQPLEFFLGNGAPPRLTRLAQKIEVFRAMAIDRLNILSFHEAISGWSAARFMEFLAQSLGCVLLVVGEDFRFGRAREGNVAWLMQQASSYGIQVYVQPAIEIHGERVSSTRVRTCLCHGHLSEAAALLGRSYSLRAPVVRGAGRGRQWGIPTINLGVRESFLPLRGVFAVRVRSRTAPEQAWFGVANVGSRPSVDGQRVVCEAHLFGAVPDLYGQTVECFFLEKLRDEQRFSHIDLLLAQIHEDIRRAKEVLSSQRLEASAVFEVCEDASKR